MKLQPSKGRPATKGRSPTAWVVFLGSILVVALMTAALLRDGNQKGKASAEPLLVYCAASLRAPMELAARDYEKEFGVPVQLQYGGSQTLLANLEVSKRGDLYLPADESYLDMARAKGLLGEAIPLVRMQAVLAVHAGNPKLVRSLEDLLRSDVGLIQANPDTAAIGKRIREFLETSGRWKEMQSRTKVFKPTVNDVANDLKLGAGDAGFLWDALLPQYPELEKVDLPGLAGIQARVSIAVLRGSSQSAAALKFAQYLTAPDKGLQPFKRLGYKPAAGG